MGTRDVHGQLSAQTGFRIKASVRTHPAVRAATCRTSRVELNVAVACVLFEFRRIAESSHEGCDVGTKVRLELFLAHADKMSASSSEM